MTERAPPLLAAFLFLPVDKARADTFSTQSVPCVIRRLAVSGLIPWGGYALRFSTGTGQSHVIEEAASLAGPWVSASPVLADSGWTLAAARVCSGNEFNNDFRGSRLE